MSFTIGERTGAKPVVGLGGKVVNFARRVKWRTGPGGGGVRMILGKNSH